MDGIIPSNPPACWGGVRQKRSHRKLVLAGSASSCESKLRVWTEDRADFNDPAQHNALYCEGVSVADGCGVAIGVSRASDGIDEGREHS
jgi:hypothetical protein